jgi:hypothetical protein
LLAWSRTSRTSNLVGKVTAMVVLSPEYVWNVRA